MLPNMKNMKNIAEKTKNIMKNAEGAIFKATTHARAMQEAILMHKQKAEEKYRFPATI